MPHFQAFNLHFQSELEFAQCPPISDSFLASPADVRIQFGSVSPTGLDSPTIRGLFYQASRQRWWLNVPSIARFLVQDGNQITIDPHSGIDPESLRLFILTSCMAALLTQRGLYVLQASAIQVGNHAVCFAGGEGAGKSTLAAAFLDRGHLLLADGLCAIGPDFKILPAIGQVALWLESLKFLKWPTEGLSRLRPNLNKFAVGLKHQFQSTPLLLKRIYSLQPTHSPTAKIHALTGMDKFRQVDSLIFGRSFFVGQPNSFSRSAELANQIAVAQLCRTIGKVQLKEMVLLVEDDLQKAELFDAD